MLKLVPTHHPKRRGYIEQTVPNLIRHETLTM